jgi:capsular polysaccharide biosynthesis protein
MELRDYLAALRRHWPIWVGATLIGALAALLVYSVTPKTYEASSTVFVSVSPSIPNSASFVQQRVKSYPALVTSEAVLAPVINELDLDESLAGLRGRVSATNPADTTQLHVIVTGGDAGEAAEIANAVAERFAEAVESLETPSSGDEPVTLTVADPAVAPSSPASPVLVYLLALGVLVGLFLGLAAAIVRDRMDPTLHTEDEVRRAWGDDDAELLVQPAGRARRGKLTGRPAMSLARRLELRAEDRPVRVVLVSPSPAEQDATRSLAEEVAAALRGRGVDATVTGPESVAGSVGDDGPRVRLEVADPLAPLRVWKHVAEQHDGVVLVVVGGRVDGTELREMRGILHSAGIRPLAVALVPRRPRRTLSEPEPATATATAGPETPASPSATPRDAVDVLGAAGPVPLPAAGGTRAVPAEVTVGGAVTATVTHDAPEDVNADQPAPVPGRPATPAATIIRRKRTGPNRGRGAPPLG